MTVVDTPVWSQLLRRPAPNLEVRDRLTRLIEEGEVLLLGPVRQEVLSGIRHPEQFAQIRLSMSAFPDIPISTPDYELAAEFSNRCRAEGIHGSSVDFLICAVTKRLDAELFTLDRDFERYRPIVGLRLASV